MKPIHGTHTMYYGSCTRCGTGTNNENILAEPCTPGSVLPTKVCPQCDRYGPHGPGDRCDGISGLIHQTHSMVRAGYKHPYCEHCGSRKGRELIDRCVKIVVHGSHQMDGNQFYNECVRCGQSVKDQNLLEQCPGPSEVDPSHQMNEKNYCDRCGAIHADDLIAECATAVSVIPKDSVVTISSEKVNIRLEQDFVWVVYEWDQSPRALSIHFTPEEAIEKHSEFGGSQRIGKWPFGMELHEAVKKWETRDE